MASTVFSRSRFHRVAAVAAIMALTWSCQSAEPTSKPPAPADAAVGPGPKLPPIPKIVDTGDFPDGWNSVTKLSMDFATIDQGQKVPAICYLAKTLTADRPCYAEASGALGGTWTFMDGKKFVGGGSLKNTGDCAMIKNHGQRAFVYTWKSDILGGSYGEYTHMYYTRYYILGTTGDQYGVQSKWKTTLVTEKMNQAGILEYEYHFHSVVALSAAQIDGRPAVAFYGSEDNPNDTQYFHLYYVRATAADGSAWGDVEKITSTGVKNTAASPLATCLAQVGGVQTPFRAAIGFHDGNDLRYAVRSAAGWATQVVADEALPTGSYLSLSMINGKPAMSYRNGDADLAFVRAGTDSGTGAWQPAKVLSIGTVAGTSLAVIGGVPTISFHTIPGYGQVQVCYRAANDGQGLDWATSVYLDSVSTPTLTSLCAIGNMRGVAYYDDGDLEYVIY